MEVISKKHPYKFYLLLILVSIFNLGIGGIFISASLRDHNNFGYWMFSVFVALTIYIYYIWIKNSSKIVLNKKGLLYKNEFHGWDEIAAIKLTGKRGLLFNAPTECATLTFKNLKTIKIFDDLYSNSSEMKYFIQEIVIDKKESFYKINNSNILIDSENELFIPYKGNSIFSFRGILMWSLILFFAFIMISSNKSHSNLSNLFIIAFMMGWFILSSFMMYYFEISEHYFVVRNHYFFWIKKIYKTSEIREIVYESQGKQPNTLRLITIDFKSKVFPAGSLPDSIWLEMKTELESKNILVRNECI